MNSQAQNLHQISTVLFDMDGVLYDSMKNHADTWTGGFKKYGLSFNAEEAYLNEGRTGKSTIQKTFRESLKREPSAQEIEGIYAEKTRLMSLAPPAKPVNGIKEVLNLFKERGIKIFVVTGSNQPILLDRLHRDFGIAPSAIVSAKDVQNGKPHPEPYLKGLLKAHAQAAETLVIENAPLGIRAAKAANLFTIGINTGILDDEILTQAGADIVFKDALSLKDWLRQRLR